IYRIHLISSVLHVQSKAMECLASLNNHGNSLATTNASRSNSILALSALQLMGQVGHDSRSRGTQGVSESNSTSVQVGLAAVQAKDFLHSQVLGSKGLVDLNQIHVLQSQTSLLECTLDSGHWSNA